MDVLGDGTVRFDTFKTLILNGATLTAPITSGLDQLNIYLQGASTLSCNGDLLTSTVADAKLSFETAPNTPGKLVLTKTTGDWFKGFKTEVDYLTNLTTTEEGNVKTILDKAAIPPINSEENPTNNVSIEDPTPAETEEYINITINDVLYTLPVSAFTYESATADEPGGVVLNSEGAPDDSFSEMDPGSPEFAEAFTGFTFRLSAGTGNVEVEATINADSHLAVKIGCPTKMTPLSKRCTNTSFPILFQRRPMCMFICSRLAHLKPVVMVPIVVRSCMAMSRSPLLVPPQSLL